MSITSDRPAAVPEPGLIDAVWTDGPGGFTGVEPTAAWAEEVRRLARARNATLLAHNYELPAIQDVADHVGDSLALSRIAAEVDLDAGLGARRDDELRHRLGRRGGAGLGLRGFSRGC